MSLPQNLGRLSSALTSDASLNIGVGVTPSGSFKLEVGTTSKFTGVATFGSTLSNGTYSYTLPSATGTLALTSDLSGYLPLTGGTLTGALSGTSATFANTTALSVAAQTTAGFYNGVAASASGSSFFTKTGSLSSSYSSGFGVDGTYSGGLSSINLRAIGTQQAGGYASSMVFILDNDGVQRNHAIFASDGSTTLYGALSGTSATFTAKGLIERVQVGTAATINDATGVGNTLQFANYSAGVFVTASADSYIYKTSGAFGGLSAQTLIFQTRSDVAGGGFAFVAGSTPLAVVTIASTGAATFSSTGCFGGGTNGGATFAINNGGAEAKQTFAGFSSNLNLTQCYNNSGAVYVVDEYRAASYSFKIGTTAALTIASTGVATFASSAAGLAGMNITNSSATSYGLDLIGGDATRFALRLRNYDASITALTVTGSGAATFSSSIAVLSTGIAVTIDDGGKQGYTITNSAAVRTYKIIAGIDGTSNTGFSIRNVTAGRNELLFTDAGAATFSGNVTMGTTAGTFRIGTNAGDFATFNYSGGGTSVKNDWASTSAFLDLLANSVGFRVSGTGSATLTGTLTQGVSDERFKKNIELIPNALEKIKSINGYTFEYDLENKDLTYIPKLGKDIGVLAQEIEQVIPEAVSIAPIDRNEEGKSKSGKNYLTVNYEKIIPLLIQGIKEQQSQIEVLKLLIK